MDTLRALVAVASLSLAVPASARAPERPARALDSLRSLAGQLGAYADPVALDDVEGTAVEQPVPTAETLVNFDYGDIIERLEQTRRVIYRGRGRNRRRVEVPVDSGVTQGDRIDRGQVTEIVLHASLGSGACEGTVNYLLQRRQAAHFMVCRSGRVYKMVEPEDIANHVKNDDSKARSIGIETESGHLTYTDARGRSARAVTEEQIFWAEDWDPGRFWIMYASIAGVIRAVARDARIPLDGANIRRAVRTHEDVDAGEPDGHTDPGGIFDGSRAHAYPEFVSRYGSAISPFDWLRRMVQDTTPPSIVAVLGAGGSTHYRVRDTDNIGLAYVRVWRFDGVPGAATPKTKVEEWAAQPGVFPDDVRDVLPPGQPGDYSIIARDLVGNITGVQIRVEPAAPAGTAYALAPMSPAQLASFEAGDSAGAGVLPRMALAAP